MKDYVDAIRFVEEKRVRLKPLMTKHYPFMQYEDAYRYINDNREHVMKVLIDSESNPENH